jgi:hypothetical protein
MRETVAADEFVTGFFLGAEVCVAHAFDHPSQVIEELR